MNEYTATNGYRVVPVSDTRPVSWLKILNKNPDPELNERHSLGLFSVEALREFFRAEEDERLGRWRWPENPEYVVYPPIRDRDKIAVVNEATGNSALYGPNSPTFAATSGPVSDWTRVARAYFDAHPEPKPWHNAKPGEVWAITSAGGSRQDLALVGIDDDAFVLATGESWPKNADFLTAGHRIYPEGD